MSAPSALDTITMMTLNEPRKLFEIQGIPIRADIGHGLLLLLIAGIAAPPGPRGIVAGLILAAVAFVSVIAHELGHAFAVRKLGHGSSVIELGMMGGVTKWRARPSKRDRIIVALAGPAVSLALALVGFALRAALGDIPFWPLHVLFNAFAFLNLVWTIFNLLPIEPMDGGVALKSFLAMRMPWDEANRLSLKISIGTAVVVGIIGLLTGQIFMTLIIGWMLLRNWQARERQSGA